MHRALLLLAIVASQLAAAPATQPIPTLRITVARNAFGDADLSDINAVLQSTARELLPRFPGIKLEHINIVRGGPITLFDRARDGSIVMKLDCEDSYWSQYAFQFGHELCHVLCRFEEHETSNLWFEESLCEMSSLFVLRQMSETWKTDAPYKSWRSYAPSLGKYAAERIEKARLPEGQTLAGWYAKNIEGLTKTGEDRKLNAIVAVALLPLFEAHPEHWSAVHHLNDDRPKEAQTLQAHLQRWHDHCDSKDQDFVASIAKQFNITLKPPAK